MKPSSRLLLISLLLFGSLAYVAGQYQPKNVIAGARKPGDALLVREFVGVPSKLLRRAKHRFSFQGDDSTLVTQVQLLDQNKNGYGASAVVSKGGPEFNYVVVDFTSARGHSIEFIVEVYGTRGHDSSGEWLRNEMDGRSAV